MGMRLAWPMGRPQGGLPQSEQPTHALSDVLGGQCGAGNILDVGAEPQLFQRVTVRELPAPRSIANLTAVALAIRQDLQVAQRPAGINAHGVSDQTLPADHFVDKYMPQQHSVARRAPDAQGSVRRLRSRADR